MNRSGVLENSCRCGMLHPVPTTLPTLLPSLSADYYFDSYAHFGIHEEMLKDEVCVASVWGGGPYSV